MSKFHVRRASRDGLAYVCNSCKLIGRDKERDSETNRAWRLKNRERHAVKWREWRRDNKERLDRAVKAWSGTPWGWASKGLSAAKRRAKQSGVPCTITREQLALLAENTTHCPVLGMRLVYGGTVQNLPGAASLDKIIPSLGYVDGNCAIISYRANRLKNDATVDDVRRLLAWLESWS